jgi:hypothetical protein
MLNNCNIKLIYQCQVLCMACILHDLRSFVDLFTRGFQLLFHMNLKKKYWKHYSEKMSLKSAWMVQLCCVDESIRAVSRTFTRHRKFEGASIVWNVRESTNNKPVVSPMTLGFVWLVYFLVYRSLTETFLWVDLLKLLFCTITQQNWRDLGNSVMSVRKFLSTSCYASQMYTFKR